MDLVNFVRCKIMFFKARFLVLAAVFQDFHCTVYLIFLTFFYTVCYEFRRGI